MNSKTKIFIGILAVGIAVISGCSTSEKQTHPGSLETPQSSETASPHGLIVASRDRLVNLVYNPSNHTYEKEAEIILSDITGGMTGDITGIVSCDNYIFVTTDHQVFRVSSEFKESVSMMIPKLGKELATDNRNIFICDDEFFVARDKDLRELSRVGVFMAWARVDDILIYENTAYILDDILMPVLFYRVNIENPNNIQISEKLSFETVNGHLEDQWLNPELDQWFVLERYAHMGGAGQVVHIYSMSGGKEPLAIQEIYRAANTIPTPTVEGVFIRGITELPPIWAVVQDKEGEHYLAQVDSENNSVSFSNFLHLDDLDAGEKIIIKRKDDYLFIAPEHGDLLKVVYIGEGQARIILSANLREFDVTGIIDLLIR
jgi:hypothetical protein